MHPQHCNWPYAACGIETSIFVTINRCGRQYCNWPYAACGIETSFSSASLDSRETVLQLTLCRLRHWNGAINRLQENRLWLQLTLCRLRHWNGPQEDAVHAQGIIAIDLMPLAALKLDHSALKLFSSNIAIDLMPLAALKQRTYHSFQYLFLWLQLTLCRLRHWNLTATAALTLAEVRLQLTLCRLRHWNACRTWL